MSLTPLTVEDINTALISQIETEIGQTIPLLPVAFVRVVAKAIAGVVVLLYKYGGFMFLQMFVSTASDQPTEVNGVVVTPLTEWGRLVGAGDPVPAVAAQLTATVTVINQTGNPIPIGTPLTNDATGVVYLTTTAVLRDAATKVIDITASSDQAGGDGAGTIGNLDNGAIVTFSNPIPDVVLDAVIASTVVTGEDAEPTVQYRQRVIDRFQKRPQGGALVDYEIWAEEAAGIVNAYPYTGDLPGTVEVFCEADTVSSGSPDGIPTAPQLTAALASIDLDVAGRATRRPANALATTHAITRRPFDIEVIGLDAPDPTATELAITDGMTTEFLKYEPFIGGVTVVPRDRITKTEVGGKVFEIAQANNATFSNIRMLAPNNEPQTTEVRCQVSLDDGKETATVMDVTSVILDAVPANLVAVRMSGLPVSFGAEVVSASLTLTSSSAKSVYSVLTIEGQAIADAPVLSVAASDISSRTRTATSVDWVPDIWATDDENVIDITGIVAEIVAITGWTSGNAMLFIISAATSSDREFRSFDDDPAKAALLTIVYKFPSTVQDLDLVTLEKGEKAKINTVTFP